LVNNVPVFIPKNATKDPNYAKYPGFVDHHFEALVIIPLHGTNAQPFGVLLFRRVVPWSITAAEKVRLLGVADIISACLRAYNAAYQAGAQINRLGALSEVSRTIATSPYLEEILQSRRIGAESHSSSCEGISAQASHQARRVDSWPSNRGKPPNHRS
jgi:hypothetical protein